LLDVITEFGSVSLHRLYETRLTRRILVPKMDEVIGDWRKLHSEKLHNFYSSPSIVVMKSRGMRWVDSVA
jgi:hypothetical protein